MRANVGFSRPNVMVMRANVIFNHGIGALLKYLTIGYQFKIAVRHVLSMIPSVQNRKPRVQM
jgi:hypothetical protein